MFTYDMSDPNFLGIYCTEPVYEPPFTTSPEKVPEFLEYLELRGHCQPKIECHTLKRVVGKNSSEMPTYNITLNEKVGFRAKGTDKNPKAIYSSLTPGAFGNKSLIKVMMRCKFEEKDKMIVPQRPIVMPTKSYRIPANTIIQLNNLE